MRIVGIRQFRQQTATLLQGVQRRKEALLLTRHGQPVGIVLPVDGEAGEDLVLACHPHWQQAWGEARRQIARGEYVTLRELRARAKER
jgi:antitoxin (DNA-binding transcriptional repressor) of toxin-antitoxin stability system